MRSEPARSTESIADEIVVRDLGRVAYADSWAAMKRFTDARAADTADELWLLEHPPVYTLGLNDRREPFDNPDGIPVVASDRGGQITYHGPGQILAYALIDLRRRQWGVKRLVASLEQSVLDLLRDHGIAGERRAGAPGVYVSGRKIAQLGLRVRRGASYHGLSFNASMDLRPFHRIKPCGYADLETIDLATLVGDPRTDVRAIQRDLCRCLLRNLGYNRDRQS